MGIENESLRKQLLIITLWTLNAPLSVLSVSLAGAPGPLQEVWALAGGRAHLPCNITAPTPNDTPILVLFYNGVTGTPVYSIDARTVPLTRSVHWSALGSRAHFDATSSPQGLVVDDLSLADQGLYRCRVDFKASPTRNLRVTLTVVVPPKRVSIRDETQREVSGVIGPYEVNKSLVLTCHVEGGSPKPRVTWWDEGTLLDNVAESGMAGEAERTQGSGLSTTTIITNTLSLPSLSRQHLYRVLTCQAANSNLTLPVAATVTLDLKFPPLEVKILGGRGALSAGNRYSLVCETGGSRPPATLTWWLDGALVTDTKDQVLQEGNVSRSTVHLAPHRGQHGATLTCRAENSLIDGAVLEDATKLNVHFSPKLTLRPGHNLNMADIKEGEDVYFECNIEANPPVFKVTWYLNGMELSHNISAGVIQSNRSLVLQKVGRASSGLYTCKAINLHGTGSSNAVQLSVKYAPICAGGQKTVYGGGRLHTLNVTCRVESHPEATSFRWAFNTSTEFSPVGGSSVSRGGRGRSIAAYTPLTHHDFGSLLCWGRNEVDEQEEPCVFHIVPAGVPESVQNCSAWQNHTNTSNEPVVIISCSPGWGGGLDQTFSLEVRAGKGDTAPLAALRDQRAPQFTVTGLKTGEVYEFHILASNIQGDSTPVLLDFATPVDVAEKRMSLEGVGGVGVMGVEDSYPHAHAKLVVFSPLVGAAVGLLAAILLCSLMAILVVKSRTAHSHAHGHAHTHKTLYDPPTPDEEMIDDAHDPKPPMTHAHALPEVPDVTRVRPEVPGAERQVTTEPHYLSNNNNNNNNNNSQCPSIYISRPGTLLATTVTDAERQMLLQPHGEPNGEAPQPPPTHQNPYTVSQNPLSQQNHPSLPRTFQNSTKQNQFSNFSLDRKIGQSDLYPRNVYAYKEAYSTQDLQYQCPSTPLLPPQPLQSIQNAQNCGNRSSFAYPVSSFQFSSYSPSSSSSSSCFHQCQSVPPPLPLHLSQHSPPPPPPSPPPLPLPLPAPSHSYEHSTHESSV